MVYDSNEILEIESKVKDTISVIDDIKTSLNNFKVLEDLDLYDGLSTFKTNTNNLSEKHIKLNTILDNHNKEMEDIERQQNNLIDKYVNSNTTVNDYYNGEKITIDKIVLNKKLEGKDLLNNYISEVVPALSYDAKKEVLKNILNGEDNLISILTDENESDIFVYQLKNILNDKDIKLDKLTQEEEKELQKEFLETITNNDTNIFSDKKSFLSGLPYYKDVAKKNNISLSDLIFENDEMFLNSTRDIYENMEIDLLTDEETKNFKEYIDDIANSNNISSLDLLNNTKYVSLIKGGIYYEG